MQKKAASDKHTDQAKCTVCNYKASERRPAGQNEIWECSHVECPHRRKVTAAPGDRSQRIEP